MLRRKSSSYFHFLISIAFCISRSSRIFRSIPSASAATDIFYMLRKALPSAQKAKVRIEQLSQIVTFADVQGADIHTALMRSMPDFEDAVVDAVAERNGASYILTRNVRNFSGSSVPAITPTEFLKK